MTWTMLLFRGFTAKSSIDPLYITCQVMAESTVFKSPLSVRMCVVDRLLLSVRIFLTSPDRGISTGFPSMSKLEPPGRVCSVVAGKSREVVSPNTTKLPSRSAAAAVARSCPLPPNLLCQATRGAAGASEQTHIAAGRKKCFIFLLYSYDWAMGRGYRCQF